MERACIYCGKHISEYSGNDPIDGLHEFPENAACCGVCHNITLMNRAFRGIIHADDKFVVRQRLKEMSETIDYLINEGEELIGYYMPPAPIEEGLDGGS